MVQANYQNRPRNEVRSLTTAQILQNINPLPDSPFVREAGSRVQSSPLDDFVDFTETGFIMAKAIEQLGSNVPRTRVAYDLCSGDGAFTRYLATIFARVIAVEINPDLFLDPNYDRNNIMRFAGDINQLPFFLENHLGLVGGPSFVVMNWAVCHMNEPG